MTIPMWTGCATAVAAVVAFFLALPLAPKEAEELAAITVGTVLVLLLGLWRAATRWSAALIFFAAVALWSGAFEYLTTEGQRHPKLDLAMVVLHDETPAVAVGYFVAHTDGGVYIAESVPPTGHGHFVVKRFPMEHVVTFSVGPLHRIGYNDSEQALLRCLKYDAGDLCG